MNANPNLLSRRLWQIRGLNFKVQRLIDDKAKQVLENKNPEITYENVLEDVSKLLTLEWKLTNQEYWLANKLEKAKQAVKEGVQQ